MENEHGTRKATSKIKKWLADNILSLIVTIIVLVGLGVGIVRWNSYVTYELMSTGERLSKIEERLKKLEDDETHTLSLNEFKVEIKAELETARKRMDRANESGPAHHMTDREFNQAMEPFERRLELVER